jgi:outer membrane protein OmpA-like peptidoglycan-associated protein
VTPDGTAKGKRHRAPAWVPAVVATAGLGLVMLAQSIPNRHCIEDNLAARSVDALAAAGINGADVSFIGRDGTVRVASQKDAEEARRIVAAVEGVRVVAVTAPLVLRKPTVTIALENGKAAISGTVGSEAAKAALVNALSGQGDLTVDTAVSTDGLSGLAAVAQAFGSTAKDAKVELRDGTLTVSGAVETAAIRDAVAAAAVNAAGAGNVNNQVTVAPANPEVIQRALTGLPQITFENDSATLTPAGQAAVAEAAAILMANPQAKVRIEGHTDGNGTDEANLALSRARALTVLNALIALGIDARRMTSEGFGESRPKVPDTTPENQAINRRVEFVVIS